MAAYDAFLLLSFGGPERPGDVIPFLENVTRGRGVPAERLAEVAEHYYAAGGASPINQQCRDLLAGVRAAGMELPLYWGNRNWDPFLADTVRQMAGDGVRHAIAFVTSAYSSYSACRQYQDDIAQAVAAVGPAAPRVDKVRPYFNHPGFIEPFAANTEAALASLPAEVRSRARLVFTAHSIPVGMAAVSGSPSAGTARPAVAGGRYAAELAEAARLIAERVRGGSLGHDLVFQSRSGPPGQPWLEPDVRDHIKSLASGGASAVVVVPAGFVSDHMEVVHDLDVEAAETAASLGLPFARAAAPWSSPRFAQMVIELVAERTSPLAVPLTLGDMGPAAAVCPADCCRYQPRARPA
jgi:protoporphyrin/coproporphyrin ferrochelatase